MRLFVAIQLSDRVRANLQKLQRQLDSRCEGIRWTKDEQLHLTVKFIGEVKDRDVPAVCDAVNRAAAPCAPFEMTVAECGCFPPRGPVRIVWAGAREETGALQSCVEHVERELEGLGYPRERRPFSPHITIGRVRDDRTNGLNRTVIGEGDVRPEKQAVKSMVLMSSELSSHGPTYTVASTAKFGRTKDSQ